MSAAYYDMPSVYVDPSTPENLRPPKTGEMIQSYGAHLGPCWDEARLCSVSEEVHTHTLLQTFLILESIGSQETGPASNEGANFLCKQYDSLQFYCNHPGRDQSAASLLLLCK